VLAALVPRLCDEHAKHLWASHIPSSQ
jgi:hypothetical protein